MRILLITFLLGSFTFIDGSSIKNTRAIVTGGANGLGRAYVHYLLLRGAKVVAILDKDVKNGTETTKNLQNQFGENRVVFIPTDVTKPEEFEANFNTTVKNFGGLDIMINNAGILDDSRWSMMIDTNIKGVIQGTLMAFDAMGKHRGAKGGTVVNIASIAAFMACQYMAGYCASKHAVLGFTQGIAMNFEQTGVAVKLMCPGGVNTTLVTNPGPRYFQFLDQDEAFRWLQMMPLANTEYLAKEVMRLIEDAPNGAIWVTIKDAPTLSLTIPEYSINGTPV